MSSPRTARSDLPEVIIFAGSPGDAPALAALAAAIAARGEVRPVLVASGMDPMSVLEAFDSLGSPADVTLLVDRFARTAAEETAMLLPRVDSLIAERNPAVVLVYGGSLAAVAGAQAACLRQIPVVYLESSMDADTDHDPLPAARSMIRRLATMHLLVPAPSSVEPAVKGVSDQDSHASTRLVCMPAMA